MQALLYFILRRLFHRRYDVEVIGLDKFDQLEGPILVWPNHPAYVDPGIVLSHLRFGKTLRPLVFSDTYRSPIFYPLMKLIDAYEVPNLKSHSRDAHQKTTELIDTVAAGLEQGENFLIYPSGRLQRQGHEVVGGSRIAYELVKRVDKVNVILVQTRGLWGSRFGCAQEGDVPDLAKNSLRSLFWVFASLFFFLPKRKVTLTVEPIPRDQLPTDSKNSLNRFLEDFYNADGGETPTFVPYHHWFGPREFDFDSVKRGTVVEVEGLPEGLEGEIREIVETHLGRKLEAYEMKPDVTLDEIGLDSLERMDLALELERKYGFRSDSVPATFGELLLLAAGKLTTEEKPLEVPKAWGHAHKEASTQHPEVLAETIAEAFVKRALASQDETAAGDPLSGAVSYRKLLVGVSLMAKRIAKLPGDSIGILLPASVAVDTVILATIMAGKLPVLLNWTTGPSGLQHALSKMKVERIVTSKRFMDRLGLELENVTFWHLEDFRNDLSTWEKFSTLAATYLSGSRFLRNLPQPDIDDPAVVLFTSGSESQPKAVPLSHKNLIANMRGGIDHMNFHRSDTLLGFLPPFHSFGLTATSLMPILSGIRVVHHADPTDARMLARIINAYHPTLMFATPTFLR